MIAAARRSSNRRARRGSAILEGTFLLPFYVFLFIGTFDWGMYAQALISVESAVLVAADYTSTSAATAVDSVKACQYVLAELSIEVNLKSVTSCNSLPLTVSAEAVNGADGRAASQVTVTYRTTNLVPIPGVLTGQTTIRRVLQMRLRS